MLTPNLSVGGAERWVVSLIKNSDPARVKWTGAVVSGWGALEPQLCKELTEHCPLHSQPRINKMMKKARPTPLALSPDCEQYVTRHKDYDAAIYAASYNADVVVGWGSPRYAEHLGRPLVPRDFVLVGHSAHHVPERIDDLPSVRVHLAAVSEAATRPFIPMHGRPVEVIHNGVDECRVAHVKGRRAMRDEWGFDDSCLVIGYVGRRTKEKNPAAAIKAVNQLGGRWRAVYYGNAPYGQKRPDDDDRELLETPHPRVLMHPPTFNLGDVYAGLDVLMLASHSEAFSLTLIEAWLARTPVVATPVGSVPELQAKYGQLVFETPLNPTPRQLADACLAATAPGAIEVVNRAHELATQQFTARRMADRWADYLERIITPRQPFMNLDL